MFALPFSLWRRFQDGKTEREQMIYEDERSKVHDCWKPTTSDKHWDTIVEHYDQYVLQAEEQRWARLREKCADLLNRPISGDIEEGVREPTFMYLDSFEECESYLKSTDRYVCCNLEHDHEFFACQNKIEDRDFEKCENENHRHYLWVEL